MHSIPRSLQLLPQYYRKFTAPFKFWLSIFVWLGITVTMVSLNIAHTSLGLSVPTDPIPLLANPRTWEPYTAFAQTLYGERNIKQANTELQLAIERRKTKTTSNVLGTSTSPEELLLKWTNDPVTQQHEITYWKSIISEHPKYQDAYIILAVLSHNIGDAVQSAEYLGIAESLNPSSPNLLKTKSRLEITER